MKSKEVEDMKKKVKQQEKTLGSDHKDTLLSMNELGGLLRAQGKLKEAEVVYRRSLEAWERTFGRDHRSTLASINNLVFLFGFFSSI